MAEIDSKCISCAWSRPDPRRGATSSSPWPSRSSVRGCFWLYALGYFALGVNNKFDDAWDASVNQSGLSSSVSNLGMAAFMALLPFPLAWYIVGTSSRCDELMAELNKARIKHGEEVHLKIQCLETALKQLVRPSPIGCC